MHGRCLFDRDTRLPEMRISAGVTRASLEVSYLSASSGADLDWRTLRRAKMNSTDSLSRCRAMAMKSQSTSAHAHLQFSMFVRAAAAAAHYIVAGSGWPEHRMGGYTIIENRLCFADLLPPSDSFRWFEPNDSVQYFHLVDDFGPWRRRWPPRWRRHPIRRRLRLRRSGLRRQEGRIGYGARRIGIWPGRRPQPCSARTPHPLGSGRRHTDPRYFLAGLAGKGAVRGRAVGIHPG